MSSLTNSYGRIPPAMDPCSSMKLAPFIVAARLHITNPNGSTLSVMSNKHLVSQAPIIILFVRQVKHFVTPESIANG